MTRPPDPRDPASVDSSPHASATVTADGVGIHYLDWGGSGPALVLVPGLGNSAHVFDEFAPRLTDTFRVLGVTRVGYGESEHPEAAEAYALPARVAHLRAVLDALGVADAVLVGHSLGGDELTAFAGTHPDRTRALVYLDAAYDHTLGERWQRELVDFLVLRPPPSAADRAGVHGMQEYLWAVQGVRLPIGEVLATVRFDPAGAYVGSRTPDRVRAAMKAALALPDFAGVRAPALALYADSASAADRLPWLRGDAAANARATAILRERIWPEERTERERFAREVAAARVESFPANHFNFLSHPAEVERRLRSFLDAPATDPERLARDLAARVPEAPLRAAAAAPQAADPRRAPRGRRGDVRHATPGRPRRAARAPRRGRARDGAAPRAARAPPGVPRRGYLRRGVRRDAAAPARARRRARRRRRAGAGGPHPPGRAPGVRAPRRDRRGAAPAPDCIA